MWRRGIICGTEPGDRSRGLLALAEKTGPCMLHRPMRTQRIWEVATWQIDIICEIAQRGSLVAAQD